MDSPPLMIRADAALPYAAGYGRQLAVLRDAARYAADAAGYAEKGDAAGALYHLRKITALLGAEAAETRKEQE